jgi:hypothetical protein
MALPPTLLGLPRATATIDERVTRERTVIVTMDVQQLAQLWIVRDYLPELLSHRMAQFRLPAREQAGR